MNVESSKIFLGKTVKIFPGIRKLVEDAMAKNYIIESRSGDGVIIRVSPRGTSIWISDDGKAFRNDVGLDLSITREIRTQKQMRKILGL